MSDAMTPEEKQIVREKLIRLTRQRNEILNQAIANAKVEGDQVILPKHLFDELVGRSA